jgi:hypothetical protein
MSISYNILNKDSRPLPTIISASIVVRMYLFIFGGLQLSGIPNHIQHAARLNKIFGNGALPYKKNRFV